MATNHEPTIGAWYINLTNQFLRVWAVIYHEGEPEKVVLHYLNGMRFVISLEDWYKLDLLRYPDQKKQRQQSL